MRVLPALLAAAALTAGSLAGASTAAQAATSAPTTYYIDQAGGSNAAAGTSPSAAWKDFTNLNAITLQPGDAVELKRGSVWTDSDIELGDGNGTKDNGTATSPIVIKPFGTGSAPRIDLSSQSSDDTTPLGSCIWLEGSYIEVHGIAVANCKQNGIQLVGSHERLVDVDVSHNAVGVEIEPGSDYDTISGSRIHDNTRMMVDTQGTGCGTAAEQCDDDYGAEGIGVGGDHATITGNEFAGNAGSSHDYGRDGSAIEVFGAEHTIVSHNTSSNDAIFSEVGGLSAANNGALDNTAKDTEYAYNLVTGDLDGEGFLVLNADTSNIYGPSYGTIVDHNTIYYTGGTLTVPDGAGTKPQQTFGWQCGQGCDNGDPTSITVFGNIIDPVNGWAEYCQGGSRGCLRIGLQHHSGRMGLHDVQPRGLQRRRDTHWRRRRSARLHRARHGLHSKQLVAGGRRRPLVRNGRRSDLDDRSCRQPHAGQRQRRRRRLRAAVLSKRGGRSAQTERAARHRAAPSLRCFMEPGPA